MLLGDVVAIINDYWDRDTTNPERLVAGEHIDEGDLGVRRWGMTDDDLIPPTFNRWFQAGDVLLHSRNIKKVARPDFGGITGEKLFILRSKDESVLLQALVPYLVQSDMFRAYAESRWAGSTNKFLNKTPLQAFEFALPPIEEQRRLVDALEAGREAHDQLLHLELAASTTLESFTESRLRGLHLGELVHHPRTGTFHGRWELFPLGDLLAFTQYGLSEIATERGRYPMLRMMNLENGYAVENDIVYIDLDERQFDRYRLCVGDVLFNRTNSYELVGRTGIYELDGDHVFASYLVRLRTNPDLLDPTYLCAFLNAPVGRRQVMSYATRGVSQTNVNASNLSKIMIPLPSIDYQQSVVSVIRALRSTVDSLERRIHRVKVMQSRIVTEGVGE